MTQSETKTQNLVSTAITTMFAVTMGFVIYKIITRAIGEDDLVSEVMD